MGKQPFPVKLVHDLYNVCCTDVHEKGLLFSLKPREMVKMRLLAIWINQR